MSPAPTTRGPQSARSGERVGPGSEKVAALVAASRGPSPVWVLAVGIALVVAAFVWAFDHRVDASLHDRYHDRLARVTTLQHRLNEQVLRAHAGLVGSYDPLVRTTRELRDLHRELAEIPGFVDADGREAMEAELVRSRALLVVQADLIERFKSQNAVLLNSLRYFPVAAAELARTMEREPEVTLEAGQLRDALRDVLRVAVFPTEEAIAETTAHLASLRPAGPHASDIALLRRHAQIITEERPAVDALLGEILEQPGEATAARLTQAYTDGYVAALATEETTTLVFLLSILIAVLGVAASVVLRMRADATALAEASLRLALAIDRQNRFVSMTSHEFRTPLSVIVSSAELLLAYGEKWGIEQHHKHLGRIERAGRAMTDLLDGMLLIGRTDAGHRDFRLGHVDVVTLAQDVVESQRTRAKEGKQIELETPADGPDVLADPRLLKHALDNLVANAVKYSPPKGLVRVKVAVNEGELTIVVQDRGIGIPAQDQDRLFDTFHRASNVGQIQGTGLGLAIVKRAVDLHGGTIKLESTEGEGTRIEVRIPLGDASTSPLVSGEMARVTDVEAREDEGAK